MNDWIRRFLREARAERNFSAHTLRAYGKDLGEFAEFLGSSPAPAASIAPRAAPAENGLGAEVSPERLERRHVRAYLAVLQSRGLQRSSLLRKASSLRSFCRWLRAAGVLRKDPFLSVPLPKRRRRLPRFLSEAEVGTLLSASSGGPRDRSAARGGAREWLRRAAAIRDRALLELLYSCGLRRAEAAGLDVSSVDFVAGTVRVFGKGGRERLVPVGGPALAAVRAYLAVRRVDGGGVEPGGRPSWPRSGECGSGQGGVEPGGRPPPPRLGDCGSGGGPLFVNSRGGRLSQEGVAWVVRRWARSARFLKPVTPHAFRHSFATHLVDRGCDLRSVQEMLGHRSLSSTQVYTHTSLERLKKVYQKSHPRGGSPGS